MVLRRSFCLFRGVLCLKRLHIVDWLLSVERSCERSHYDSLTLLITMQRSYYTRESFARLRQRLEQMKSEERPRISQAIAEAREKGDLRENAEYHAAKEAQGLLEAEIARLEQELATASVIDKTQLDASRVCILSTVTFRDEATKKAQTYTLVSAKDVNLKQGRISVTSPVGQGLLGKKVGERARIQVPSGTLEVEVLAIEL